MSQCSGMHGEAWIAELVIWLIWATVWHSVSSTGIDSSSGSNFQTGYGAAQSLILLGAVSWSMKLTTHLHFTQISLLPLTINTFMAWCCFSYGCGDWIHVNHWLAYGMVLRYSTTFMFSRQKIHRNSGHDRFHHQPYGMNNTNLLRLPDTWTHKMYFKAE
jgi:hypothetical protein